MVMYLGCFINMPNFEKVVRENSEISVHAVSSPNWDQKAHFLKNVKFGRKFMYIIVLYIGFLIIISNLKKNPLSRF